VHLRVKHITHSPLYIRQVEDLEHEALQQWEGIAPDKRVYLKATQQPVGGGGEGKEGAGASTEQGSFPPEREAPGGGKPPNTNGEGNAVPPTPPPLHPSAPLLSPSLSCPFVCGCEHLVPGSDYVAHVVIHLVSRLIAKNDGHFSKNWQTLIHCYRLSHVY